ncbi:hypothetical protein GPALN_004542 [Globodera pallida]|nr:hypothetical protein GPALN_004542 [Globodera pallida]
MSITKSTGRTPKLDNLNPIQLIRILLSQCLITLIMTLARNRTKLLQTLKMSENVMISVCEHTCGLCAEDACFDAGDDCTSLRHLCFHHAVSPLLNGNYSP